MFNVNKKRLNCRKMYLFSETVTHFIIINFTDDFSMCQGRLQQVC